MPVVWTLVVCLGHFSSADGGGGGGGDSRHLNIRLSAHTSTSQHLGFGVSFTPGPISSTQRWAHWQRRGVKMGQPAKEAERIGLNPCTLRSNLRVL